jgi:NitT/TauT family transport system substrate-binding protein
MSALRGIAFALAIISSTASLPGSAEAKPLRIFYFTWVGFGPLFVAQDKGFFAKEGLEVSLIRNDDHTAAFAGLAAGHVDAVAGGLQDAVVFSEPNEDPLQCVLVNDDTRGADGIVASKHIRSIADLRGKAVTVDFGSSSQFYLNTLLKRAGLSEGDLNVVDLEGDAAGEAFLLGEVDAAVTCEPWLSQTKNASHAHLLTDTSKQPGLLVDCVVTTPDVFRARQAHFRAFSRAWHAAVKFTGSHPDEANEIIARNLGGSLEDPAVVGESLRGIHFYDGEENRRYFGTPDDPGPIYETVQQIIEFWSGLGRVKADIAPADVIAHGIWSTGKRSAREAALR